MGSECSSDEREFRYSLFHQSLFAIDKDIKKDLDNQNITKKKFLPFGLINHSLCEKYKFLLNEKFDKNEARNNIFEYKDLFKKNIEKNFEYINKKFCFAFPSNFIFVNKDFLDVIYDYINDKYKNRLTIVFDTIIGGDCLIMKNPNDKKNENPFRYIILYFDLKENKGNEIDFFYYIKDKNIRNSTDEYILKNNIWNYFKKINYDYKEEFKKIEEDNKEIGYIVRSSDVSRIDYFISKTKEKSIKESFQIKYNQNEDNKERDRTNPQKRTQSEDKYRKHLNNDFPMKMIQNNAYQARMPFNSFLSNKDNNMMSNLQMNKEINKAFENKNNINIFKNNSQNLNINNMNIPNQSIIEENNRLKNENNTLKRTIQSKDEEIKELKAKIFNLSNKESKNHNLVDFDNIKIIQFMSMDHSLIFSIKCLPSDTFAEVEEKLYKKYPEYRETNNSFQIDGRNILRFKTIEENNIPDEHYVQISKIE